MIKSWTDAAWEDFEYWMAQDKKTLRRILQLLKDIERNGYDGIGKPERLSGGLSNVVHIIGINKIYWVKFAIHFG